MRRWFPLQVRMHFHDAAAAARAGIAAALAVAALLAHASPARAQDAGTGAIAGVVTTNKDVAAKGARVVLVELRRRTFTDERGEFRIEGVPPGHYHVQVLSPRFGSALAEVDVAAGETATPRIRIDLTVHTEEVVVTATPDARSIAETGQSVAVLRGPDLQARVQATLGETLAQEPGVSSTYHAPGSSRPVIRGLSADRVRILEDGLGTQDASNVSPDHAVSLDPMRAERIEVVRGPATLRFGSNAVGGVVNVLDGRVPDHVPERIVEGTVDLRLASAAEERATSVALLGGAGAIAWQAGVLDRRAGDLDTPAGLVENSDLDASNATAGLSWIGPRGHLGGAFTRFGTNYGPAVEPDVRVDLVQKRFDLRGEWNDPFGPFRSFQARLGRGDYEHRELEGGETGTLFENESWEGRFEWIQKPSGRLSGSFGLQIASRDFAASGEEVFVEPNTTRNHALFALEEIGAGALRWQFGARLEQQDTRSSDPDLPDRDLDGASGSAGIVWRPTERDALFVSASRSTRFPTAEELYSNGPHLATKAFEVGDPNLSAERSTGVDLSYQRLEGRVRGEVSVFWDRFHDYIYDRDTGQVVDRDGEPLPVFQFVQEDATFHGAEGLLHLELFHAEPHHVELDLRADFVRAELDARGEPLPRIPPLRLGAAIRYRGARLWGEIEGRRIGRQDRVSPTETETPAYSWVNAAVGYRILTHRTVHDVILRATNLTDRLSLNHVSRFKELVPLPGRDVALSYRLLF